jgi:hypothetical protein
MQSAVEYIVVDECHCIVQWCPNFRTDNIHCAIEIGFCTSQYLGIDSYCIEMYAVGSGKKFEHGRAAFVIECLDRINVEMIVRWRPSFTGIRSNAAGSFYVVIKLH